MKVNIQFDGGCRGNPGAMYGSYRIMFEGGRVVEQNRIEFGHGTNNVAEFQALIAALQTLSEQPEIQLPDLEVSVITDSMIVKNRLMGKNRIHRKAAWRERSQAMFNLACECLKYLTTCRKFKVEWRGRESNVAMFGH